MMGLLGYLGYHFFKGFFSESSSKEPPVKGKPSQAPLDLGKEDVEDAKFKDIEEK